MIKNIQKNLNPAVLSALTALSAALVVPGTSRAGDGVRPSGPPPEVRALVENFSGRWTASSLALELGPERAGGSATANCERGAGGWAARCDVTFRIADKTVDEAVIVGFDAATKRFHFFSINSTGEAHDHHGSFDGTLLSFRYEANAGGKRLVETLSFEFRSPRELWWKAHKTLGGQQIFSGQGAFRK